MPVATLMLAIDVQAPAEKVFEAIVDLRGYGRWLDSSADYGGTIDVSDDPVTEGTTYAEPSRLGVRRGTVTEFRAPELVTFDQPMTLRPRLFGEIDIRVSYTLTSVAGGVRVERAVMVTLPWVLRPVGPVVLARFRRESGRTMQALKAFVERQSGSPGATTPFS